MTDRKKMRRTIRMKMMDGSEASQDAVESLPASQEKKEKEYDGDLDNTFISEVLEATEEDDFPKYELRGQTVVREGKAVDQEDLVKDYQKLMTEVRRLESVSTVLYNNTIRADVKMSHAVEKEGKKWKKLATFIAVSLVLIATVVTSTILYIQKQKHDFQVKQQNLEKLALKQVNQQLALEKDRAYKEKDREREEREKEKLAFEQRKKDEMKRLEEKLSKESLSEKERQKILAQAESQYREQQHRLSSQLAEQKKAMEKLALIHEKERKKLERENRKKLEKLERKLAKTKGISKEERKTLLAKEAKKQQKELLGQLGIQVKAIERQRKALEKERKKMKEEREREKLAMQEEFQKLAKKLSDEKPVTVAIRPEHPGIGTKPPDTRPEHPGTGTKPPLSGHEDGNTIALTEKYDAREIMGRYYRQKMVKTEVVDATIVTEKKKYKVRIYRKNSPKYKITEEKIEISQPKSIRGEAYLTVYGKKPGKLKAWRYDIGEGRTQRVSEGLHNRLLDSEFTYEDWFPENMKNYNYTVKTTMNWRGKRKAYIVLARPTKTEKKRSQYLKKYYWVDMKINFPLQIKYFGKDNKLSKIYAVKKLEKIGVQVVNGKTMEIWRPSSVFVVNAKTHKTTVIQFENWKINRDLPESTFSPQSLSRGVKLNE